MRTVAISDTHGKDARTIYDSLIHTYEYYNENGELIRLDNIVFLGDYVDNHGVNQELQVKRLLDLFELKDKDDRIHILIGNHDAHYLDYHKDHGYPHKLRDSVAEKVKEVYDEALIHNQLEYAFFDGKYFYCHEGITKDFINAVGIKHGFDSKLEVCNHLNKMLAARMFNELFTSQDGLKFKYYKEVINNDRTELYNQWTKLKSNYAFTDQVLGHFADMGMQQVLPQGIYMIENNYHGNFILFES